MQISEKNIPKKKNEHEIKPSKFDDQTYVTTPRAM